MAGADARAWRSISFTESSARSSDLWAYLWDAATKGGQTGVVGIGSGGRERPVGYPFYCSRLDRGRVGGGCGVRLRFGGFGRGRGIGAPQPGALVIAIFVTIRRKPASKSGACARGLRSLGGGALFLEDHVHGVKEALGILGGFDLEMIAGLQVSRPDVFAGLQIFCCGRDFTLRMRVSSACTTTCFRRASGDSPLT